MNETKTFFCAHCGARLEAPAGATVACPSCGRETQEPSRWAPRPPEARVAERPGEPERPVAAGPIGVPPEPAEGPVGWGRPPAPPPGRGPGEHGAPEGPVAGEGPWAGPPPAPPPGRGPGESGAPEGPVAGEGPWAGAPPEAGAPAPPPPYGPGYPPGYPQGYPQGYPPYPTYPPPPNNGLAIASLVLGILGLGACMGPVTGIPAIVCGVLALRAKQSEGVAWAGVITGCLATLGGLLILGLALLPILAEGNF